MGENLALRNYEQSNNYESPNSEQVQVNFGNVQQNRNGYNNGYNNQNYNQRPPYNGNNNNRGYTPNTNYNSNSDFNNKHNQNNNNNNPWKPTPPCNICGLFCDNISHPPLGESCPWSKDNINLDEEALEILSNTDAAFATKIVKASARYGVLAKPNESKIKELEASKQKLEEEKREIVESTLNNVLQRINSKRNKTYSPTPTK
jgi:hypothetical protein